MSSFSDAAEVEVTVSPTRFSLCLVNKSMQYRELRTLSNRSRGCQTLINLRSITDVDEVNPFGIEIWYRTTIHFSILDGIEVIRYISQYYIFIAFLITFCFVEHRVLFSRT